MGIEEEREKERIGRLYAVIVVIVFLFGGAGALGSSAVAMYWGVNVQVQAVLWVLFAFFIAIVLAGVVGALNLKSLDRHLGID